jgi:hypothetical protein
MLTSTNTLIVMDYIIAVTDGINMEGYIPGYDECLYNLRDTCEEYRWMMTFMKDPDNTVKEDRLFNATGTISWSMPDFVYTCYWIPKASKGLWYDHRLEFED